jgi:hypothetical protein
MPSTRISGDAVVTPVAGDYVPFIQVGSPVTAGSFVTGTAYVILSIGSTDFTAIGAASNTVGLGFVATGAGSGTGTAGSTSNQRASAQTLADLSTQGLYGQVRGVTPTRSNTGLSTDVNASGATITDGETGIIIRGGTQTDRISGISKAAPSAPYSIDVLIEHFHVLGGGFGAHFGWYDGTKLHVFGLFTNTAGYPTLYVLRYATTANGGGAAAIDFTGVGINTHPGALRIRDDGTNVHFAVNPGGSYSQAEDVYTIAKASGYLGGSGYSNIFFGINRNNGLTLAALMSYTQR